MIGTDIVEVSRIKNSIEKFGDLFLNRTFSKAEQEYCEKYWIKEERYAGRFAAKEAIAKVIKKGPKDFWLEIEVSISHEKNYAVAVAKAVR